ncbi:MAG: hypothetical protein L3J37_12935 [Rhodobacteraceae bacterium]|nr:hypothetical protein [Paracoccaceae bacterium]
MGFIIDQNRATDVEVVGGKAASLARLADTGFNPPAFFVISADGFRMGKNDPVAKTRLKTELKAALKALGPGPFAVRSSARQEDGAEHSHAGQFDTVLNVASDGVFSAARHVWASGFSETVQTYRRVKSGGAAEAPSIIVQRMIDAISAGVAFSADPVTGQRDRVMISAIAGLGEQLVSGEADGEDWVIGSAKIVISSLQNPVVLTPDQAQDVANLARRAQAEFGAPQDIEWAFDADGLHILQARPITTDLLPEAVDDQALTIFDNSNIVESYPGMVSPLTYSFALHIYSRVYRAFVGLLGVHRDTIAQNGAVFDNMLGRIDGRVYYNLVNWYRVLALLPGFSLNRAYMETMMGVSEPMPGEITDTIGPPPAEGFGKVVEYLKLAKAATALIWQAIRLPLTRKRFYGRLNAALHSGFDVATAAPSELAAEYRKIESTLLDRWDAPLINDFFCMIAFGASRNLMEKWLGPDGLLLHNDVMIGQGDIVSAEPAQRIAKMGAMVRKAGIADALASDGLAALDAHPEIAREIQSYLDKFGDRCTEELKLESIPLSDDPSTLLFAVAASAERENTARHHAKDPDWPALFPGRPVQRVLAKGIISWTKARVRDRENLRFERTRIFGHARRVFLAIGREFAARGLLAAQRDVFFLTTQEILGAIEGFSLSPDLKSIVDLRKTGDAASGQRPDPPERIQIRGPAIAPIWDDAATPVADNSATRTATGCSAGQVQAKACIIRDPRTQKLNPGDILVARHTDPGWIAVFSNASAIVVERGSLLSHSAIVARELGIPCVVGLKDATNWIADGEMLKVDGATGVVERCDAEL